MRPGGKIGAMSLPKRAWFPSFWPLQASGWAVMYSLLLVAALPHLGERDILRYNTLGCAVLFCLTLLIRPVCRAVGARWVYSWLALEASAFVFSLLMGTLVTFATGLGTFGWARLNAGNWMISGLQSAMMLFLWCSLYFSIKTWQSMRLNAAASKCGDVEFGGFESGIERSRRGIADEESRYAERFAIKTGTRIQVVSEENVLWISAARDYAELHTRSGTHLLRETMRSLEQRLDPARFVRIHRSRIVRWDQIVELSGQENGEYLVKLRDGSEHRCSRTYAGALVDWLGTAPNDLRPLASALTQPTGVAGRPRL
jgi:LytTr DNA-binding domain